jgi:hypothetical protein
MKIENKSKKNKFVRRLRVRKVSRKIKKGGAKPNYYLLLDNYKIVKPKIKKEIYYGFDELKDGIDMVVDYLTKGLISECQDNIDPVQLKRLNESFTNDELTKIGNNVDDFKKKLKEKIFSANNYSDIMDHIKIILSQSFKYVIDECNLVLNGNVNIKSGYGELICLDIKRSNSRNSVSEKQLKKVETFIPISELLQNAWDSNLLSCDTLENLKEKYIKIIMVLNEEEFEGNPTIIIINKGKPFPFKDNELHTYDELKNSFKPKSEEVVKAKDTEKVVGSYSIFGGRGQGLNIINNNLNYKLRFRNNERGESMVYLSRVTPIGISDDD